MGQPTFLTLQTQVYWPSARFKAQRVTCTIIRLRSLAVPGGVFDIEKAKCPPDRNAGGSPGWVTDNLVYCNTNKNHSNSTNLFHPLHPQQDSNAVALPCPIPVTRRYPSDTQDASTPPLTPDLGSDCGSTDSSVSSIDDLVCPSNAAKRPTKQQEKDALDFLLTLFPHDGLKALPFSKSLSIAAPNMGTSFDGVILDSPDQPKTLYVDAKHAELASLRESIVALLDLADDTLGCSALIIVLERTSPVLGELLHSLMYVGGTVVTKPLFKVDPAFVLVGLEI
ncbi:ornithine decarboxylase antizyme-domain-containing protein [Flagelloscypha sp. PMI_526]|nr:ornithine decarboxylase antizyme-domain-containing protein [Flagelloscypha sp. PMI_526]